MSKSILVLILLSQLMLAQAEEKKKIYKYTDENGVTHYTETKPTEDYEEADLPQLSVVPSSPVKARSNYDAVTEETDPAEVKKFDLLAPSKGQNLWGSGGQLTAQVSALSDAQKANFQVQFIIDGVKHKPADTTTQVFNNIYRGEHTVQGLLINRSNNKVMRKTDTITFFMHQNSKK